MVTKTKTFVVDVVVAAMPDGGRAILLRVCLIAMVMIASLCVIHHSGDTSWHIILKRGSPLSILR